MIRLNINIDHVATIRNQRDTSYPDLVMLAGECLRAGADGITVHLREDRRHIRDGDVEVLRRSVNKVVNLEMAPTAEMAAIAERIRPDVVTLVPERREERTTEGGLDVVMNSGWIEHLAETCARARMKLSLFIEASPEQVRASKEYGAAQVEFHTGHFCSANPAEQGDLLSRLRESCVLAHELKLEVAAGHGLTRDNVGRIAGLPHLVELNIGHAVISDAMQWGMFGAVSKMRDAIAAATTRPATLISGE